MFCQTLLVLFFLVFLFYYVWGFFLYIVTTFSKVIDYFFLKFNKNFMMFKRDFNDLGFFEKIFLVLFSKNNLFKNSIGNIYTNDNLFNYRKKKYPLIFFFHLYSSKTNYKLFNLKLNKIVKLFNFFKNSNKYNYVNNKFKNNFFKKLNNVNNETCIKYLIHLILQKLLYKRYYNLCSSIFFKNYSENNLIKFNWLFYLFLINSNKKYVIYDLSKYFDWYDFTFKKNKIVVEKKIILEKNKKKLFLNFRKNDIKYLKKIYNYYNVFFKKLFVHTNSIYKNIINFNFKELNFSKLSLNTFWKNNLVNFYPIRFSESSVSKHIELNNFNNYLIFYIRKNRIFNKGRYSRNRQLYRTGVYWCLWLNIILVYGLYFLFYRFTFNFGYFWWGLLILFYSTIFSRAIKYNFYNFYKILNELLLFNNWLGFFLKSFIKSIFEFISFYRLFFINSIVYFNLLKVFLFFYKITTKNKLIYFWENMTYNDNSFFRYKTLIHWFTQFYKLITY